MRVLVLSAIATVIYANTSPPPGAHVVGAHDKYKTISEAISAASPNDTIFIKAGVYYERLSIEGDNKKGITLIGETVRETSSYLGNLVTIRHGKSQDNSPNGTKNDMTATVRVHTADVSLYYLNIVNTRGPGSPAVALSVFANRFGGYMLVLDGFQDTLLSGRGTQFFFKNLLKGATDFHFGLQGRVWTQSTTIETKNADVVYVSANGRNSSNNPSFFVYNRCNVTGSSPPGSAYLGRPWRNYARVVFQNSFLDTVVNKDGWSIWSNTAPRTDHVSFAEYKNYGPGANKTRKIGKQLTSPVTPREVLGSVAWIDKKHRPGWGDDGSSSIE